MNKIYGFLGEIQHKYDDSVMKMFSKVFQALPLAAVIQGAVFVVHGGLSTQEGGVLLKDIEDISRVREPPESGLMSDLLWSGASLASAAAATTTATAVTAAATATAATAPRTSQPHLPPYHIP
jgi:hypothetical protein